MIKRFPPSEIIFTVHYCNQIFISHFHQQFQFFKQLGKSWLVKFVKIRWRFILTRFLAGFFLHLLFNLSKFRTYLTYEIFRFWYVLRTFRIIWLFVILLFIRLFFWLVLFGFWLSILFLIFLCISLVGLFLFRLNLHKLLFVFRFLI